MLAFFGNFPKIQMENGYMAFFGPTNGIISFIPNMDWQMVHIERGIDFFKMRKLPRGKPINFKELKNPC